MTKNQVRFTKSKSEVDLTYYKFIYRREACKSGLRVSYVR